MDSATVREDENLWKNLDFLRLWAGQAISQIGSQVSFLALPLIAATTLHATAFEMGLLAAAGATPALLVGLYAGVYVDRHQSRPILIGSDFARAMILILVPLAWILDVLSIQLLLVVSAGVGLFGLFFDVAYQAFLPTVVPRDRLLDGNAKLEMTRTASEFIGPGLAGVLLQLVVAPIAIAIDACSYLLSGLFIARIRRREPVRHAEVCDRDLLGEIREGVSLIFRDPRLRASVSGGVLLGFFNAVLEVVVLLYIVRQLGIGAALLGAIFAVGSLGFLVGSLLPERLARRIGFGRSTCLGIAILAFGDLLVPLANGTRWVAVPMLMGAEFVFGIGLTIFKVNQASLRQTIVPSHLLGRVTASTHVLLGGVVLAGALVGGFLGEVLGLRATLILAAGGEAVVALWLWRSPLRVIQDLPVQDIEETLGAPHPAS
jgi:MFS family permease